MTALDPNRQAGELRRRASGLRRCAVLGGGRPARPPRPARRRRHLVRADGWCLRRRLPHGGRGSWPRPPTISGAPRSSSTTRPSSWSEPLCGRPRARRLSMSERSERRLARRASASSPTGDGVRRSPETAQRPSSDRERVPRLRPRPPRHAPASRRGWPWRRRPRCAATTRSRPSRCSCGGVPSTLVEPWDARLGADPVVRLRQPVPAGRAGPGPAHRRPPAAEPRLDRHDRPCRRRCPPPSTRSSGSTSWSRCSSASTRPGSATRRASPASSSCWTPRSPTTPPGAGSSRRSGRRASPRSWQRPGPLGGDRPARRPAVSARCHGRLNRLARGLGVSVRLGEVDEAAYRRAALDGHFGDQYAAALLVRRGAAFPSAVTGGWALDVLEPRARPRPGRPRHPCRPASAHASASVVLAALTADPVAGRQVLLALDELDVLLGPHLDGDRRGQFLLAAVDPARFPVDETVTLLQHVLGYLESHRSVAAGPPNTRDLHDWLGPCLAPYLLQLVPSPSVPVADWGSTDVVRPADLGEREPAVGRGPASPPCRLLAGAGAPRRPGQAAGRFGASRCSSPDGAARRGRQRAIERGQIALWAKTAHDRVRQEQALTKLVFGQAATELVSLLVPSGGRLHRARSATSLRPCSSTSSTTSSTTRASSRPRRRRTRWPADVGPAGAELELTPSSGGVATAYARLVADRRAAPAGTPPPRPDPCDRTAPISPSSTPGPPPSGRAAEGLLGPHDACAAATLRDRDAPPSRGPPPRPAHLDGFDSNGRIDAAAQVRAAEDDQQVRCSATDTPRRRAAGLSERACVETTSASSRPRPRAPAATAPVKGSCRSYRREVVDAFGRERHGDRAEVAAREAEPRLRRCRRWASEPPGGEM